MSPDEAKKIIRANYPPANYRMLREALGLVMSAAEHPELFGTSEHFPDATKKVEGGDSMIRCPYSHIPTGSRRAEHSAAKWKPADRATEKSLGSIRYTIGLYAARDFFARLEAEARP